MSAARFQTFDDDDAAAHVGPRMAALRQRLAARALTGFILPRADAHQNEYVPAAEERLAFLTGFTGSAGTVIVLADRAVLFTDGRYTLQARAQLDDSLFAVAHSAETPPETWIEQNLPAGARLGYDPWLHTADGAEKLRKACTNAGAELLAVDNPVDAIWTGRPPPPCGRVVMHDLRFAGEDASAKLARIVAELARLKADALVVSDPHASAWIFNIRGADVAHTPLPLCFALIAREGRPSIFIDGRKLDRAVREGLQRLAEIRPPEEFVPALKALGAGRATVRLDQATAADAIRSLIEDAGGRTVRGPDPVALMKAVKNETEIEGARAAHRRDAAAMARFLAWFDREAPRGTLGEIAAAEALEDFRRATGLLRDISFPTISGSGPNGAIVHYRVSRKSDRRIAPGELYLVDSGAQYEDGTTDITRTIAVGEPQAEMRERFTLVLKGHIAIARAVFPAGTTGAQIDSFARQYLWRAGLDFDHGTGHGVGSYLSVHEGPARISRLGTAALKPGMILSNEPGYYKTGAYGIRIENLVLVSPVPAPAGAEKDLLGFETLTLAPLDRRLIVPALMDKGEIAWIDAYHARVRETVAPLVEAQTAAWLETATAPLQPR